MHLLYTLNKPTIAKVNGSVFGGGLGLLSCCDIAITDEKAKFAFTEVRLGLVPAVISPYIVMAIGARQTRRLFLTGQPISSHQAQALGLVHEVVNGEQLDGNVENYVGHLLKAGPLAMAECKKLMRRYVGVSIDDDLPQLIAELRVSNEGQEGIEAFLDKRKPSWVVEEVCELRPGISFWSE